LIVASVEHFRQLLGDKLAAAMQRHPARIPGTDPYLLADMFYGAMEGAYILARALGQPELIAEHCRQFRSFLELLFQSPTADKAD
ncbi:MAG TPA: hypothetical protein VKQ06_01860, partial [Gammaproteobacteria bacterium]|nr:hypothetical protein [Gammaproteobacteria bacterium]